VGIGRKPGKIFDPFGTENALCHLMTPKAREHNKQTVYPVLLRGSRCAESAERGARLPFLREKTAKWGAHKTLWLSAKRIPFGVRCLIADAWFLIRIASSFLFLFLPGLFFLFLFM